MMGITCGIVVWVLGPGSGRSFWINILSQDLVIIGLLVYNIVNHPPSDMLFAQGKLRNLNVQPHQ